MYKNPWNWFISLEVQLVLARAICLQFLNNIFRFLFSNNSTNSSLEKVVKPSKEFVRIQGKDICGCLFVYTILFLYLFSNFLWWKILRPDWCAKTTWLIFNASDMTISDHFTSFTLSSLHLFVCKFIYLFICTLHQTLRILISFVFNDHFSFILVVIFCESAEGLHFDIICSWIFAFQY